jgi:hypothetical protein
MYIVTHVGDYLFIEGYLYVLLLVNDYKFIDADVKWFLILNEFIFENNIYPIIDNID